MNTSGKEEDEMIERQSVEINALKEELKRREVRFTYMTRFSLIRKASLPPRQICPLKFIDSHKITTPFHFFGKLGTHSSIIYLD
jgi:hypothetical protein